MYDKTLFKIFGATIVAIIALYPKISGAPYNILDAFANDEIKDDLWLPLMIVIMFGCVQIYYMQRHSNDTAGMMGRKYFDNYLLKPKYTTEDELTKSRFNKYKAVTRRIINIFRAFKPLKKNDEEHKDNPMYKLYWVTVLFWAYASFFFGFRLVFKSHFDQTVPSFTQKFICFYNSKESCHNSDAYFYVKILFSLFLIWMLILVYQLKHGLQVWASSIIEFNTYNKHRFGAYSALPFFREIMVMLSFTTNKTALGLKHWFIIHDIRHTMTRSKFMVKDREQEEFGVQTGPIFKNIVKVLIIILAVLVVVGPMIFFSDAFSKADEYPINTAVVKIDIVTNKGQSLNPLFKTDMILKTDTIKEADSKWSFLNRTDLWKRTKPNFFKFVRMSRYSQTFYEYTPSVDLETTLTEMLTGGNIRIQVEFQTDEGKYGQDYLIPISKAHAEEIKTIMETKCKSIRLNREMFLENIPMVYELQNNQTMAALKEASVLKFVNRKWSLGIECTFSNLFSPQATTCTSVSQTKRRRKSSSRS